jgi:hypothetical protein
MVDLRRQLDRQGIVPVIRPEDGTRARYRVREGGHATQVRHTDQGLRIDSNTDCSLVELITLPDGRNYQVVAVARMERMYNAKAAWGIYFNHRTRRRAGRVSHAFELAGVYEHVAPRATLGVLTPWHFSPTPAGTDLPAQSWSWSFDEPRLRTRELAAGGQEMGWCEIRLTVRGGAAQADFRPLSQPHGVSLGPQLPEDVRSARRAVTRLFGVTDDGPADPIRIGIVARQCVCQVRSLEIE